MRLGLECENRDDHCAGLVAKLDTVHYKHARVTCLTIQIYSGHVVMAVMDKTRSKRKSRTRES